MGGAHQEICEAVRPAAIKRSSVAVSSAAKDAGRAILLSWEITDFPGHGELRTGLLKRWAAKRSRKMLLAVGMLLTVRPLTLPSAPVF